ncbi:MAG: hypothetical protein ACXVAJ_08640 [Parachlamydiaceae bacterium]
MTTVTIKKEERKALSLQDGCVGIQDSSNEDNIFNSLHSLEIEEKNLIEQKENLKALLQQLESKAKEEIEKRSRKIEGLNSDVSDLKRKVKKFANWVNSDSSLGSSEADP